MTPIGARHRATGALALGVATVAIFMFAAWLAISVPTSHFGLSHAVQPAQITDETAHI